MTRSVTDPLTPVQLDRLVQVVDHVVSLYGSMNREQLLTSTMHCCAEARSVVAHVGVYVLDYSATQIAVALGTRHRATISLGLRTLQRRMRVDPELAKRVDIATKTAALRPLEARSA